MKAVAFGHWFLVAKTFCALLMPPDRSRLGKRAPFPPPASSAAYADSRENDEKAHSPAGRLMSEPFNGSGQDASTLIVISTAS